MEQTWVWRPGVLEEGALQLAQPGGDLHLPSPVDDPLLAEHEEPVPAIATATLG